MQYDIHTLRRLRKTVGQNIRHARIGKRLPIQKLHTMGYKLAPQKLDSVLAPAS